MKHASSDRSAADVEAAIAGQTVPRLFARVVSEYADHPALTQPAGAGWRTWSWSDYADQATRTAALLSARGIGRGDTVALMLRNRVEFHVLDMAAHLVGAVPFSIYNTSSAAQIEYLLDHADARIAIVEPEFVPVLLQAGRELPQLREVLAVEAAADLPPRVADLATEAATVEPLDLATAAECAHPDDLATLIYTSGTTGPPKGVMLTHRNICWVLESFDDAVGRFARGSRLISWLPMAHLLERMYTQYLPVRIGAQVFPCSDIADLNQYMIDVRPHFFGSPPRIWEKLRSAIRAAGVSGDEAAAMVGLDHCEVALVGAAPTPEGLVEYFQDLGIPLSEGYGLSESTAVVAVETKKPRAGSVGRPTPGSEISVAEDGEICCRGGHVFAGYFKDPDRTAEVLSPDGWFYTGDVGVLDDDGYLRLIDRKKELIITAGGKNVSPANIEAALKQIPFVGQACVVGERRPYLVALLVLDQQEAQSWAQRCGIQTPSVDDLATHEEILTEVRRGIAETNASLSRPEQVKEFRLLGTEWLPDSECLTPTLKLKRHGIHHRYSAEIEQLYLNVQADAG